MTSRRCWRLREGCLEHALIGGVTFAFFSLSELRRKKNILSSLLDWDNKHQQQHIFQRRRFYCNFKSSILFEFYLQLNRLRLFYFG